MRPIIIIPNTLPANAQYPYGRARDNDGTGNGTPVIESVFGDMIQLMERMMAQAEIVPNNLPDNTYSGFQLFQALQNVIANEVGLKKTTDLNEVRRAGVYNVEGTNTNIPAGLVNGQMTVSGKINTQLIQRIVDYTNGKAWVRFFNGTVWSAWTQTANAYQAPLTWATIPLINGWASESGATAEFRYDAARGDVEFRGRIDAAGSSSGIFNDGTGLPAMVQDVKRPIIRTSDNSMGVLTGNNLGFQVTAYDTGQIYDLNNYVYHTF